MLPPPPTLPRSLLQTPQFILLSHDDHITVTSLNAARSTVNQFVNPGGCNVPLTWFVSGGSSTNCAIARRLLASNHGAPPLLLPAVVGAGLHAGGMPGSHCRPIALRHCLAEIASHTLAHAQLVPGAINITDQIAAQRAWLNTTCGLPLEKMVGFRAPYLVGAGRRAGLAGGQGRLAGRLAGGALFRQLGAGTAAPSRFMRVRWAATPLQR